VNPRTRFAPTPSGFLHAGNAWSFLLTWLLARSEGGSIHLRIDDLDTARFREEYIEDIFASLEWLGLDWDTGPRSLSDIKSIHSQHLRIERYRAALKALEDLSASGAGDGAYSAASTRGPLLYACACSREKARRDSLAAGRPGIYPGTCRNADIPMGQSGLAADGAPAANAYPLRLRVPDNAQVTLEALASGPLTLFPGRDMGDFVVWQRNGEPAYQLASLVDDEEYGIDLVVRGRDLLPSTGAQAWLAGVLGYPGFRRARFLHHGLMLDPEGEKLSKSQGADSLRALRGRLGTPEVLLRFFAGRLGLDPASVKKPADMLEGFAPGRIPDEPVTWADFARETGLSYF
jgi:glutamyl/glutaminyl-tRNA synthetase